MRILVSLAAVVVIAVGLFLGAHAWWVDTHCTTVLGTQVCADAQTSQPAAAAPSPPPETYPIPPGAISPGPRPGTYYVSCLRARCTTSPGGGPDLTTCTTPSTGVELCTPTGKLR